MKVIDDFISSYDYDQLKDYLLGTEIRWKFNDHKVQPDDGQLQFTHMFFETRRFGTFNEKSLVLIDPIFARLNPDIVLKVKANLEPKTEKPVQHLFHRDTKHHNKTAVYYVNTNNGGTIFKNGDKVDSKANRIVIFDAQELHAGVTCTDEQVRVVLNLNYFPIPTEQGWQPTTQAERF